jgi:hypothetical protein
MPRTPEARSACNDLAKGWGVWLKGWRWTHFARLTLAHPMTEVEGWYEFRSWLGRLAERAGTSPGWFVAMGRDETGQLHLHALLNVPLNSRELQVEWPAGPAEVTPFDRSKGTMYYCAKAIRSLNVECDFDLKDYPDDREAA